MPTMGRWERRRVQSRATLAKAALQLFLEHGYDGVTVAQIADAADLSLATVFKYVPGGKEALIFDEGTERREGILNAVRERGSGTTILQALREFLSGRGPFIADDTEQGKRVTALIVSTPALREYSRKLWTTCEQDLAAAIAYEAGRDPGDMMVRALARFVLEIPGIAGVEPDPPAALEDIFALLERGWPGP